MSTAVNGNEHPEIAPEVDLVKRGLETFTATVLERNRLNAEVELLKMDNAVLKSRVETLEVDLERQRGERAEDERANDRLRGRLYHIHDDLLEALEDQGDPGEARRPRLLDGNLRAVRDRVDGRPARPQGMRALP